MGRLVTIPISHYCEKARWALDLCGEAYREDGWPPAVHRLALARLRATTAPVYVADDGTVLRSSTAIVRHADAAGRLGLFGDSAAERAVIDALIERFDHRVGPPARLLVYAALLDEPGAFLEVTGTGVHGVRRAALRATHPLVAATIKRYFRIDREHVARARATLEAEVAFADEQRGDSLYLQGDRFSAADLTFAALLAPQVQPEGYGLADAPIPDLATMPPSRQEAVARWRATPSGRTVLELYARHRRTGPPRAGTGAA